ncbi:MAG: PorV/PorQ family protein [candidate division WOR-3 bacterium]
MRTGRVISVPFRRNQSASMFAGLLVMMLVLALPAEAAFTKIGMAGLPFLKIGVGRCTGMGDAFVAVADDASAAFWNPAGLALASRRQIVLNHIDWLADVSHEYVAAVVPTHLGNWGLSVTALSLGQFEETTIGEYQGTGRTFSGTDLASGISYSRMLTDKLAFGVSVKVVSEQIGDYVGTAGVAFDFGIHYNTAWRNLRLAMAMANFGPDLRYTGNKLNFTHEPDWEWPWTREPIPATYLTETFPLPTVFRFGLAYDVFSTEASRLLAAVDLNHFNDVNEKLNFGLEYRYGAFSLRGGYVLNVDPAYAKRVGWSSGLSAGTGLAFRPAGAFDVGFDYSYRNLGRLGMSHRVTLTVGF